MRSEKSVTMPASSGRSFVSITLPKMMTAGGRKKMPSGKGQKHPPGTGRHYYPQENATDCYPKHAVVNPKISETLGLTRIAFGTTKKDRRSGPFFNSPCFLLHDILKQRRLQQCRKLAVRTRVIHIQIARARINRRRVNRLLLNRRPAHLLVHRRRIQQR